MTSGEFMLLDGPDQMTVFERLEALRQVCEQFGIRTPGELESALKIARIRLKLLAKLTVGDLIAAGKDK